MVVPGRRPGSVARPSSPAATGLAHRGAAMPGRDRSPLILAAELPEGTAVAALSTITDAAASDRGVEFVSEPGPNDPESPTAVMWELVPITGPQDEATTDLVQRLRDDVVPPAEDATGIDVTVTGKRGRERRLLALPVGTAALVVAAFLALSFLLMMVVFWSLLVPLKAVIKNLVSIGAAYRLVVALFQWGWLSDLTDVQPVPIEPWAPMMLFAIVFGLSIDNDVFLLSRVREEWHRNRRQPHLGGRRPGRHGQGQHGGGDHGVRVRHALTEACGHGAQGSVYFSNDPGPCAVRDAIRFAKLAREAGLAVSRTPGPDVVALDAGGSRRTHTSHSPANLRLTNDAVTACRRFGAVFWSTQTVSTSTRSSAAAKRCADSPGCCLPAIPRARSRRSSTKKSRGADSAPTITT
jgi:hypothetical protein